MNMRKRTSGYSSDKEEKRQRDTIGGDVGDKEDYSLLLRPLQTTFKGFQEAKLAYENGTQEVRQLLMHECSLIYECNVCRNMFRSLANFISHKRIFCCSASNQYSNGHTDHNSALIIQSPENDGVGVGNKRTFSPSCRDLSSVIERLKLENSPKDSKEDDTSESTTTLRLERMPNSTKAMYQTIKKQASDSIKTEVNEVHNLLSDRETVLGPDGKAITKNAFEQINDVINVGAAGEQQSVGQFPCEKCESSFQTDKTLQLHIQKKHTSSAYVFQCPSCPITFMQPSAVIRHLANEHKKPGRRLRMMRESILKRCVQAGDVQSEKIPSRELKRLQLSDDNKTTEETVEPERKKPTSVCSYCGKSFERRAAYASHFVFCRAKHENIPNPIESKRWKLRTQANLNSSNIPPKSEEHKNRKEHKAPKVMEQKDVSVSCSESLNDLFAKLPQPSFGDGLHTVSLDKLNDIAGDSTNDDKSLEESADTEASSPITPTEENEILDKPGKASVDSSMKVQKCRCKICNKQFNALSNLRRHISMFHYRSSRFGCKMCKYRAFRRYDVVNHLGFVHKMEGEREFMASEYVSVHEVHYTKDDVDSDIVMLTGEPDDDILEKDEHVKKRSRRKRTTLSNSLASITNDEKTTRQSLKRSFSYHEFGSKALQKRPIRNRINKVNKDFVYDLSNLTDKTAASAEKRRRNTLGESDLDEEILNGPVYNLERRDKIKAAIRRIALQLVKKGLAKSSTLPELPTERPQVRPRLISTYRSENSHVPVVESSELEAARLKSPLLDFSFIAKNPTDGFKLKPCLEHQQQHSALNSLLQKVDSSLHYHLTEEKKAVAALAPKVPVNAFAPATPIAPAIPFEIQANGSNFNDPEPSIPMSSSPPPTPRKHMSLLQRFADHNKNTSRDSLLRTALEH